MNKYLDLEQAVDELENMLEANSNHRVEETVRRIISLIPIPVAQKKHEKQVTRTLKILRKWRLFELLQEFCGEILRSTRDRLETIVRTYWAQALIDLGHPDDARKMLELVQPNLESSTEDKEKSEVIGLLGRAHKDLFLVVNEVNDLNQSIDYYAQGFPLDAPWHGANLVALISYAERARIKIEHAVGSEEWANRLLDKLDQKDEDYWSPWECAAAGEASLAIGSIKRASRYFQKYWRSANNPFMLAGTERQLRNVWYPFNKEEERVLVTNLATNLEAFRLSMVGTSERYTPEQLVSLSSRIKEASGKAEALFDSGPALPLKRILSLLNVASRVCRITDPNANKSGTGFLVEGEELSTRLAGQKVLLTNHHVLHDLRGSDPLLNHEAYRGSMTVKRAVAEFHYWDEVVSRETFPLSEVVYSSPRNELDFSVVTFKKQPEGVEGIKLNEEKSPFPSANLVSTKQRGKIFVIGYPQGGELSFSVADNEVVDHELTSKPVKNPGVRRIHYRAATEPGSSGSPVLHHQYLEVVGLHRSGAVKPLRDPWPGKAQGQVPYEANEAISIRSIGDFIAGV